MRESRKLLEGVCRNRGNCGSSSGDGGFDADVARLPAIEGEKSIENRLVKC